ncbi:signal transduction histidine kinase [Silvibacterium bohemicum]|uniref:histidine kinase n=1 Tax=Silvibacterium bohemicum TaxID=1577686 RepID=A0A841JWF3_9BACT|nr:ATP-binding protein [Silvibacterium bohemicum]MBB6142324.1 signal transduction histidine kinase [Silvibacterium bohemicum]
MRSTLAFAVGSAAVFVLMYGLVASAVRERGDSWLIGESETLKQVASTTQRDALYGRIVEEVAELATQELAYDGKGNHLPENTVFFLQTDNSGRPPLWVGPTNNQPFIDAIGRLNVREHTAISIRMAGWRSPFRVVAADLGTDGGRIYLGLLDSSASELLFHLLLWFVFGWICMVGFGFLSAVLGLRRTLKRVDAITTAASSIDTSDLGSRVFSASQPNDEIARLARAFNTMLDRISASVNQLRTLTDAVAHDMKSPITSVRGGLEAALSTDDAETSREYVAKALEHLDRLAEIVTTSLDVAEAEAGALRLRRETTDLGELVRRVADLYTPAFHDHRQSLTVVAPNPVTANVDHRFFLRLISNLLENELRYAGDGARIELRLAAGEGTAVITIEDDGPGFPPEMVGHLFQRFVKGNASEGHGLGLAFVKAVACAHGGSARATNQSAATGVEIVVEIPIGTFGNSQPETQPADELQEARS